METGRLYLVLRGYVKGHRSEERVWNDWVMDEWVAVFTLAAATGHFATVCVET